MKNTIPYWRNKADKLLTPIIKKLFPKCEACGEPTQVAHHWIEKSRSNFLRYDIKRNLVALCHSCHTKIHNRFGNSVTGCLDVADVIIKKRGKKWEKTMKLEAPTYVKSDWYFFQANYEKLKTLLNGLG